MNSSSKKSTKTKALVILFLALAIFSFWKLVLPQPQLSTSPEIALRIEEADNKIRIIAQTTHSKPTNQIDFYLDNQLFFRGFASQVSTQSSSLLKKGKISFIFDDGWLDVFTEAFPIFEKYHFPASVAVIKSYVDKPSALTKRQLRVLAKNGWEILAHGAEDRPLTDSNTRQQEQILWQSKKFFWQEIWGASYFVFPLGAFDEKLLALTKKYYQGARGYEDGINKPPINSFDIKIKSLEKDISFDKIKPWIDQAEKERLWLVFVGHHVSAENQGQYTINPKLAEQILEYLSSKDLQVETFGQAIQELDPKISIVKGNTATWEFEKNLLSEKEHEVFAVIDKQRSKPIKLNPKND